MNTKANCDPTIPVKKPAAPSVTRRAAAALLVGGAAGVGAQDLVGSPACAAGGDPSVDSAIAAHAAAEERLCQVIRSAAFNEMEKRNHERYAQRMEDPNRPKVLIGYNCPYTLVFHESDGDKIRKTDESPVYLYDHDAIDRHCDAEARKTFDDPAKLAEIEDDRTRWHEELGAQESEYEKSRKPRPASDRQVRKEYNRASNFEVQRRYELVDTEPATLAGAAALVRYVYGQTDLPEDTTGVWRLLATLDKALQRFAHGAAKEMIPRYRHPEDEREDDDIDEVDSDSADEEALRVGWKMYQYERENS
jgi:hypothetical protein